MDKSDKEYNALNEFLDQCINEALQETTDKFQVGIDHSRGIDYEQFEKSDRFNGFKKDKHDPEGEKMKDYERPPPFKVFKRPLTPEETKSYRKYEERLSKLKPGKDRPSWTDFDTNLPLADVTEEYSENMEPKGKAATDRPRGTNQSYSKLEEDSVNGEPQMYHNLNKPKVNPNIYPSQGTSQEKPSQERWAYKPTYSGFEQPRSTYGETTSTDRSRRYSEPATWSEDIHNEGKYQTYENFYKTVAKSDLKPDNYKENLKPGTSQDTPTETKTKEKEEMKPGCNSEKVKKELLKLRPPILDRVKWGALPPMRDLTAMVPPADTLVFTLNTGTPACSTESECHRTVREIQARHMGKGLADIQYNFLVGGDGNLYEGRGWAYESGISKEKQQGKNYNIAFIGNYQGNINDIPSHMLGPVQELVVWGNAIRLISNETKKAGEYKLSPNEVDN